jgi:hypothetical protein
MQPLNLRSHAAEDLQRFQRRLADLFLRETAGAGHFAFDNELGHSVTITRLASTSRRFRT